MFLPQPRFYFRWKRIRIRLSVQFFQPVLMSFFDELRIFQKIRSCACHDFCRRQHALMGEDVHNGHARGDDAQQRVDVEEQKITLLAAVEQGRLQSLLKPKEEFLHKHQTG